MAGYIILDAEIIEPGAFVEFAERIVGVVDAYGGKYLVRGGGAAEVITGDFVPHRVVIIEFESAARAREFINSPEYDELSDIRLRSFVSNEFIVKGV